MASSSVNKNWAVDAIVNPLHEPTPAEETGLGSSLLPQASTTKTQPSVSVQNTGSSTSTNPFRRTTLPSAETTYSPTTTKNGTTTHARAVSNGSPSASPRHRASATFTESPTRRSAESSRGPPPAYGNHATRPRRSSSLREKFPGDPSVHPLEQLTKENKAANRSPHLRKKHTHGSDSIDKLDDVLGSYHHEGPYDAASLARNNSYTNAPLAALAQSNKEALKATPRENIEDAIMRHRPLDGTSSIAPGEKDRFGRTYAYKEGLEEDMMRNGVPEGGAYKQYPGITYLPEDLKGKGEPSYSIEKQLKDHKRNVSRGHGEAVELVERPRRSVEHYVHEARRDGNGSPRLYQDRDRDVDESELPDDNASMPAVASSSGTQKYSDWERGHGRKTGSPSGSLDGLKRRIGSLRKKDK